MFIVATHHVKNIYWQNRSHAPLVNYIHLRKNNHEHILHLIWHYHATALKDRKDSENFGYVTRI